MSSRSPRRRSRLAGSSAPGSRSAFQRLMIIHQQLPELCIDGGLDEGASIEELSEQILYYRDALREINHVTTEERERHATSEAVRFAGLCSALLSLPSAMAGNGLSDNETREVHLSKATLVFVPLEAKYSQIVAVAQVHRSNPASSCDSDVQGSGSPLAIRTFVEKCHELFCLLRGSIHETLAAPQWCTPENDPHNNNETRTEKATNGGLQSCTYPGMDQLYNLRKQLRRLKWEASRSLDPVPQEVGSTTTLIASLEKSIRSLAERLPIYFLRMQLRTHYDEYLANAGLLASSTGVLHRCLVENVPVPIAEPTVTLAQHSPMAWPSPVAVLKLGKAVQNLLDNAARNRVSREPLLVGISSFFKGNLIFSHKCPDQRERYPLEMSPLVSPPTACMLMEFMASYRRKILLHSMHHSGLQTTKAPSSPRRMNSGFRRFLSGSFVDEDTIIDTGDVTANERKPGAGRFLSPPPLSMLNVSDKVLQVDVPAYGSVWTPLINLPSERPRGNSISLATNLALFDVSEYSFLLNLRPGESLLSEAETGPLKSFSLAFDAYDGGPTNSSMEGVSMASSAVITDQVYSQLLQTLAVDLANAANGAHDCDGASMDQKDENAEAGQCVVFVDRIAHRLVLLSDEDVRKGQSLGDKKAISAKQLGNSTQYDFVSSEALSGIDCRHLLVSSLPPDVVSAFDDVMSDVHSQKSTGKEKAALQICTYMPQGWVYAHAHNDQELYIFFNASKFVTVSDVEHAADRVRTKLFNECHR